MSGGSGGGAKTGASSGGAAAYLFPLPPEYEQVGVGMDINKTVSPHVRRSDTGGGHFLYLQVTPCIYT
jgi:hypothetical protein